MPILPGSLEDYGAVCISRIMDPDEFALDFNRILRTPNGQRITHMKPTKKRLLVYTRSRVYYWTGRGRRHLRLWKLL